MKACVVISNYKDMECSKLVKMVLSKDGKLINWTISSRELYNLKNQNANKLRSFIDSNGIESAYILHDNHEVISYMSKSVNKWEFVEIITVEELIHKYFNI